MKIGVDFGKVIMEPIKDGKADTSFLGGKFDDAMKTPPSEHAFDSIKKLVEMSNGNLWIVSKCGPSVQNKTKAWLKHWDFYRYTGMSNSHVRFCLRRDQKALISKQLKLTHFIDDRLDVLEPMEGVVDNLFLFGEQNPGLPIPDFVVPVIDWAMLMESLQ